MVLENLQIINFRNLENQKITLSPGINVFYGDNAQGKTNLLEAIYLLSTSKSFRAQTDNELVTWNQEFSKLVGKADFLEIEMTIKEGKKHLLVNSQERKFVDLIGSFLTVLFTPEDTEIISGSPDKRRRFLDQLGSKMSKDYLRNLVKLAQVLRARNQVLWQLKQGQRVDIGVWDSQLAKLASLIWAFRFELILALQEKLTKNAKKLLGGELNLVYVTSAKGESTKKIEEKYLLELEQMRPQEIARTLTLVGPQRDDFKTILEIEQTEKIVQKDLNIYGSRGEQRAASLALKFCEIEILETEKNARPALLLDDVFGELDSNHQKLLLERLKTGQSFITTTNIETVTKNLGTKYTSFEVKQGKVLSSRV